MKSFLSTLLLITALNANAQIELFKDINPDPELSGSGILQVVELDGVAYFGANDMTHGTELWRSDGTDEGTYMVKDILTGSEPGFNQSLVVLNGILYFRGVNGTGGAELFRSDGTEEGTFQVFDNYDGPYGSSPEMLTVAGNYLFFRAYDDTHGVELWRSDGSAEGTILLKDAVEGTTGYSNIHNLVSAGNMLYYACYTPEYGLELWKSDGSPEGTEIVKDITQGSASTQQLSEFTFFKDKLFFNAKTSGIGQEIWVSDGTDEGTSILLDIAEGPYSSSARELTVAGELLFFNAQDQYRKSSLWKSDGTPEGTQTVENNSEGYGKDLLDLTDINGILYYAASNEYGSELWRSDGTLEGTYMIKDINTEGSSSPRYITYVDGMILFSAETEGYGRELWKSDGSAEGTVPVKDIFPGEGSSISYSSYIHFLRLFEVNNKLFFPASDGTAGIELWVSDGTSDGTMQIDINPGSQGSNVNTHFAFNGFNFFLANDGIHGTELWKSDGTPEGTQLFLDINDGEADIYIQEIVIGKNAFYFWVRLGDQGFELWKSDGTVEGSKIVIESDLFDFDMLSTVGDTLYYLRRKSQTSDELWLTDGTEAGTHLVNNIDETNNLTNCTGIEYNGLLIFKHNLRSNETKLWRSNGSPEGTYPITAFNTEGVSNHANNYIEYDDTLYISVHNGTKGGELWKSDGTNEATSFFMNFDESAGSGAAYFVGVYNDQLLFTASSPEHGSELWSSDGSIANTSMIKDINTGQTSMYIRNEFVQVANHIYFTVINHPDYGAELWRTDLTENGTHIVRDIAQGPSSSTPGFFITANDALYFSVSSESYPYRHSIWKSEGDSCSTVKLAELDQYRYFESLFVSDNKIVFASDFENFGRELVSYNTDFDPLEPCKSDQVIDFNVIGDMTVGDGPEALIATASSGLEVSFFSSSSTVLVNNAEITALSAGKAEVSASQEGDELFRQAGEVTQTICINPVQPVITGQLSGQTLVLSSSGVYNNQWYFNSALLAGETATTLIAEQDGVYTVQSSFEGCKSIMSENEIVSLTGILFLNEADVSIYPNPASTELMISFPSSGHRDLKIYDSLGKGMLSFSVEGLEARIDLGSFISGTYLMLIHTEGNIQSHKFSVSTGK